MSSSSATHFYFILKVAQDTGQERRNTCHSVVRFFSMPWSLFMAVFISRNSEKLVGTRSGEWGGWLNSSTDSSSVTICATHSLRIFFFLLESSRRIWLIPSRSMYSWSHLSLRVTSSRIFATVSSFRAVCLLLWPTSRPSRPSLNVLNDSM